jgi:predicted HAD superfamily phosphohydrolase YqeG
MPPAFEELDAQALREHRILLDVDGTLVADGEDALTDVVQAQLATLAQTNAVYLHSNKGGSDRLRALARATGVHALPDAPRKPQRSILHHLPPDDRRPLLVIGDKWVTDGWFARRVGARFLRVARKRSYRETIPVRLTYALDDLLGRVLCTPSAGVGQ